jgi:co-chaperonin GroES (HSP10)
MSQIKPVGQKILVRNISNEETLESGIVLPETNNADLTKGVIVDVSDELLAKNPCPYVVGEAVLYFEKRAIGVRANGEHLFIIDGGNGLEQGDVLAVLK